VDFQNGGKDLLAAPVIGEGRVPDGVIGGQGAHLAVFGPIQRHVAGKGGTGPVADHELGGPGLLHGPAQGGQPFEPLRGRELVALPVNKLRPVQDQPERIQKLMIKRFRHLADPAGLSAPKITKKPAKGKGYVG
jgi:hypothetical protein